MRTRACCCRTGAARRTCSRPGRLWRAIFWARDTWPAWAWPSARCSGASRAGRPPKLRETEAVKESRRLLQICNACRYCEGYCAVFPAMELRRQFASGDLSYLANLCHDCRGCYYACQYAPPHEWAVNLPRAFAQVRAESYAEYAWPRAMGGVFRANGTFVSLALAAGIAM